MMIRGWRPKFRKQFKAAANERGATIALVAVSMVALLGFAALAVDVGHLLNTRTESQRVADAAALAGAGYLLVDPDDSVGAVNEAIAFAARNSVNGAAVSLQAGDVDVDLDSMIVTARVYNTSDRGNAPGTFFAKVLGINTVDVVTYARAWAAPASGIESGGTIEDCVLPVGLLDYYDADGDGQYTPGEPQFGFDESDHGKLLKLTVSGSSDKGPPACQDEPEWEYAGPQTGVWNANPDVDYCNSTSETQSWSCWYQMEEGSGGGATDLGNQILGNSCNELYEGQTLWQASAGGEKQSLTSADDATGGPGSFRDLIELDLAQNGGVDLVWCVAGSGGDNDVGCPKRGNCSGACVTESPRLRAAPVLDPNSSSGTGANNNFTVSGFTGLFIEKVACNFSDSYGQLGGPAGNWNVYVRLMTARTSGTQDGTTPPDENSLIRQLRLIE
jgi:Flp pilus assembly protein TadG